MVIEKMIYIMISRITLLIRFLNIVEEISNLSRCSIDSDVNLEQIPQRNIDSIFRTAC